jgi:uncharacterized membrane protein
MTTGMMQLLAVGFDGNEFNGRIIPELDALRESGIIRLIDLAFVMKDEVGDVATVQISDLTEEEKLEFGIEAGALIGFGAAREAGAEIGAEVGAESVLEGDFGIGDEDLDEIGEGLANNSSALLMLVEHLWSRPLKQALLDSGAQIIGNWIIQPEMLVEFGEELASEREAAASAT